MTIIKKSFIIMSAAALLVACGKSEQPKEAETVEAPNQEVATTEIDTLATDSIEDAENQSNDKLSVGGVVTVDPDKYASVTVLMGGTVGYIAVHPGQFVQKGSVVATINNPEFVELQQTYIDAAAQTEFLEAEYNRQQNLSQNEAASKKKLQQSKAEYLSMKSRKDASAMRLKQLGVSPEKIVSSGIIPSLTVTSPISGYVGDIAVNIGKYVSTGDCLCRVVDQNAVMLQLTAYSKDVNEISVGTKLTFVVKALPGKTFEAVVTHIDPIMDVTSHSLKVYAKILGKHANFNVVMYVRATIIRD